MPLSKILEKPFNSRVSESVNFDFDIKNEGFYLIKIVARAGAWWQQLPLIYGKYWLDDELRFSLDEKAVEPYFNGNSLYGTRQFIILFERLKLGNHSLVLKSKGKPFLEAIEVAEIIDESRPLDLISLTESKPEDTLVSSFVSRKKSWITLVSSETPFLYLLVKARARDGQQLLFWRTDDDDLQLRLNGEVEKNDEPKSHDLWYWCGRASKGVSKVFEKSLTGRDSIHRIDLPADRSPEVSQVLVSFRRIPTVDDPLWTGSFDDDTDVMLLARLIFGEAEGQPKEAKIGIGFTVLNRLKKKRQNWGYSVREIILKENQYDGLWNTKTYSKVRDPLNKSTEKTKNEWFESCAVAQSVLDGSVVDTSSGATNFHSFKRREEFPPWAQDRYYKTNLGDIYFYELES